MKNSTKWLLCISAGVVTALPWWGAPGVLLLICFVPLMMVERSVREEGGGVLSVLPYSFVFFLCWNLLATWWIARIHIAGGMSVIVINSAIMCMVFLLYSWIRESTGRGAAILVILWLGFEFIHHRGDMSWPWLSLGNGLASNINLIQWYEFTGVTGGSLWVLSVNAIIFNVIRHYRLSRDFRTQYMCIIVLFAAILIPTALSLIIINTYAGNNTGAGGFLILQTGLDPYDDKYRGISNSQRLDNLLELAEENMREGVKYIVSPETSVDSIMISSSGDEMQEKVYDFIGKYPGTGFIMGATSIKPVTETERTIVTRRDADGNLFDVYNSALFFFQDSPLISYNKFYLANGVEQIPFQRIFNLPQRLSIDLGGISGSLKRGEGPIVVISPLDSLAIGPLICFESAYGEYSASKVRKGAEIFIIITNDGWFRNTGAYKQHLRLSRIRAVETRRSVVRSANYGISCYISPTGEVKARLGWQEEGALYVKANTNSVMTFYASSGDFIGRTALFFSILLMLNMLVRKKMPD